MKTLRLIQGSPEWLAHRASHLNASDAPAMMGCSSYKSRSQLIKELATGITPDVDAATQRRFDDGHRFEVLARPIAEGILGKDLYPVTGSQGRYSASFDGLDMTHTFGFEHKMLNNKLREAMHEACTGESLPLEYQVQMEHQAMVAGVLEKTLFMASKWEGDELVEERHCWYYPNPELRAQIVAGWEQLEKDVAAYDPSVDRPAPAVAAPVESLPAVVVQVSGALTVGGNLDAFGDALRTFIERIPKKPSTDQEFADADAACKALKKAEEALATAKDGALSQVAPVEVMCRTVADLQNLARTTRLATEKLVAAEKDARRTAIVTSAQASLDQHLATLNQRLGVNWIPRLAGGFGEVIKGKKSLANMEDAVAVALTNAKADMNALADRLETNRKHLMQEDGDWIALFADFSSVGAKACEDFQALAALRIGQHKQAEAKRLEAERERIRAEEERKAQEAAARTLEAERQRIRQEEAAEAQRERERLQAQAQADQQAIAEAAQQSVISTPVAADLIGLAQNKVAESVAAVDAQQVISAAKAGVSAAPLELITLGQLNAMLAPIKVDAAGLTELGMCFEKERGAVRIDSSVVPKIIAALMAHLKSLTVTA